MIRPWNRVFAHKQFLFTALVALLAAAPVLASAATEETATQVDKVFADLQKPGSPGCALGVFRNGQIIYSKGYGLASVELDAPITPQTVFDIGSTSKQFTAASILLLEQQGKLSINDDVRKYIPELPDYSKSGGTKITILNLLNHTSGLRDYLGLLGMAGINGDSVTTDDDALALITRQKNLTFAPGSEWRYSNTGFFLLSVIVKRVSGMTLREFASKNIFQPLQMTHTNFRDDHTMLIPHRALAYDPDGKNGYKLDLSYFEQSGDGAVHTSVEDLAKWDENFYSAQIGGKSSLTEIQERGKLNNGKTLQYAKGLFILDYRGLRAVRHGGAWGGYRAELLRFPEQHFSVACLCNMANATPGKRADKVAEIYLGGLMKPKWEIYGSKFGLTALSPTQFSPINFPLDAKITFELDGNDTARQMKVGGDEEIAATYQRVAEFAPSTEELAAYVGDFKSDELAVVYRVQIVDGKLNLATISDNAGIPRTGVPMPSALRPTISDEFEIPSEGVDIDFTKDARNHIIGFDLDAEGTHGIQFVRIAQVAR